MDDRNRVVEIIPLLEQEFGAPRWKGRGDPLASLIQTVLSQSTNDLNRDRAFDTLIDHFPTWYDVMNAPSEKIADAIRVAGLANQKSVRIKEILQWIEKTYGSLNIDFICDMDPDEVTKTFLQLKGIGIKTISVVLMFTCGVDVFPVDTHVHRICRRIGFLPDNASAEKTHWHMQSLVPEGKSYSFHMNLLKLGRTICKAKNPKCPQCPILRYCQYGQRSLNDNSMKGKK